MKNLLAEIFGSILLFFVKIAFSLIGIFVLIAGLDSGTGLLQFAICLTLFFFTLWQKPLVTDKLTLNEMIFASFPILLLSSYSEKFEFKWVLMITVAAAAIILISARFFSFESTFKRKMLTYCSRNRYLILSAFLLLSWLPLNLDNEAINQELKKNPMDSRKLVEVCNNAVENKASFTLTKCAVRLIMDKQSSVNDKTIGINFSEKALEESRAKRYLKVLESYYAKGAACLNMFLGRKADALTIAQKYKLHQEQSLFEQDQNCKNN
jgi:hypothetical protein